MMTDLYSELLGDRYIHDLHIDFVKRKTTLLIGGHPADASSERKLLTFTDVAWQDLSGVQDYNILWGMEVADCFDDFSEQEAGYLSRMKNYVRPDVMENIEKDKALRYYFIYSTIGLKGFVICKGISLTAH